MSPKITTKICLLALSLVCISVLSNGKFGKAEEELPHIGGGGGFEDPSQIVSEALICFNDKYIYSTCEEAYRLGMSGNLHVPHDHTDEFCDGSCLTETNLVLNCIENIVEHFEFYNRATIHDVRETVRSGCGHGIERGDFNVAEHIQDEESKAQRTSITMMVGIACVVLMPFQLI